jgi:hypothetical protein
VKISLCCIHCSNRTIALEHAGRFAGEMLKIFGVAPRSLSSDDETIYIFSVTTSLDRYRALNFSVEHEHLSKSLSDKCGHQQTRAQILPGRTAIPNAASAMNTSSRNQSNLYTRPTPRAYLSNAQAGGVHSIA